MVAWHSEALGEGGCMTFRPDRYPIVLQAQSAHHATTGASSVKALMACHSLLGAAAHILCKTTASGNGNLWLAS
jgi:hypothetical protein